MEDARCPRWEVLKAYVLGELDEQQAGMIADHTASCDACQTALDELDRATDPLIGHIRGSSPVTHTRREKSAGPEPDLRPERVAEVTGRLGHYRILGLLGRGGMGVVYQAVDVRLERPVALKVIHPRLGCDASVRLRFLREARAIAALKSDHVVTIHDLGEEGEIAFIAMELLTGETLAERLARDKALPWQQAARLGAEIAVGLAAVHEKGLIHRDVKPANVWLEAPSNRAKLLDFGLARPTGESLTTAGLFVGTPHYAAPEQVSGPEIDCRADLYSLGVVLYRACSGTLPVGEGSEDVMAVLSALATQQPTDLRKLQPDVPPDMANLVMSLLAKRPEGRPPSALEVADAFRRLSAGAAQRRVRPRFVLPLILLLVVSAVGLAIHSLLPERHERTGQVSAEVRGHPRTLELIPADYHFLRFSTDGQRLITASFTDADSLVAVWDFPTLRQVSRLGGWNPGPRNLKEYSQRLRYQVLNGALSPDGGRLGLAISGGGDNSFALWDMTRPDDPLVLRHGRANVHALAFSPDGKLLATGGSHGSNPTTIKLWNPATGQEVGDIPGREANWVNGLAFSHDGRRLYAAYLSNDWIDVLNLAKGSRLEPLGEGIAHAVVRPGLTLSANNSLAFSTRDYEVHVLDVSANSRLFRGRTTAESFWGYAFSHDGRRLATPDRGDETVTVWDVQTDKKVRTVSPTGAVPRTRGMALSPGGRWLVTVGVAGTVHVWDMDEGE